MQAAVKLVSLQQQAAHNRLRDAEDVKDVFRAQGEVRAFTRLLKYLTEPVLVSD